MATKKKVTKKKVAKKKATKKVVAKKEKSEKKKPLSRFICELIVNGDLSDDMIVKRAAAAYPDYKVVDKRAVSYYRNFIDKGRMEKLGFPPSKKATKKVAKKATKKAKKKATKKVATKKKLDKKKD